MHSFCASLYIYYIYIFEMHYIYIYIVVKYRPAVTSVGVVSRFLTRRSISSSSNNSPRNDFIVLRMPMWPNLNCKFYYSCFSWPVFVSLPFVYARLFRYLSMLFLLTLLWYTAAIDGEIVTWRVWEGKMALSIDIINIWANKLLYIPKGMWCTVFWLTVY